MLVRPFADARERLRFCLPRADGWDRLGRPVTATRRSLVIGAAASAVATPAAAAAQPRRVVSLSNCLDVILVHVADRAQIAALSHYAREPQGSTIAALARTLPVTWETAEEVLALRPDLVLTSRHSSLPTRNALNRLGVKAALFGVPKTVAESLAQVREVAALVGHPARGERLVARIEAALAAAAPPPGWRPLKAALYQPNGFSPGGEALIGELMTRTGFDNVASRYGLKSWGYIPLERLLADPPEVLLVGEASPGARSWADRVMTHPALKSVAGRMRQATIPERLMFCGGPVIIPAVAALAASRTAGGRA